MSLIRFFFLFLSFVLLFSCASKKPVFRTPLEVFKGHDGKKITEEQLGKFFEAAENANRDARSVAFEFLSKNLSRFEKVADFLLSRVSLEQDYNVKATIFESLIRWNKGRASSSSFAREVGLKPNKQQLSLMIELSNSELKKQSRVELHIASIRLMESVFAFAHKNKIASLDEITEKVKVGCLSSFQTSNEVVFPYALFCIKSMRDRGVNVAIPSLPDASKNSLAELYLDTKIFLQ